MHGGARGVEGVRKGALGANWVVQAGSRFEGLAAKEEFGKAGGGWNAVGGEPPCADFGERSFGIGQRRFVIDREGRGQIQVSGFQRFDLRGERAGVFLDEQGDPPTGIESGLGQFLEGQDEAVEHPGLGTRAEAAVALEDEFERQGGGWI